MNAKNGEIRLFHEDEVSNLLPNDGMVNYYGKILNSKEANQNFDLLMKNILWQNDEVIIFGKHIITKRKAAWYGDSDYLYTYSNSTKQALPWTEELSWLRQIVEELVGAKFNSCLLNLHHNAAIRSCRPNEIIKLKLKIFISKLVEITNTLKFY